MKMIKHVIYFVRIVSKSLVKSSGKYIFRLNVTFGKVIFAAKVQD